VRPRARQDRGDDVRPDAPQRIFFGLWSRWIFVLRSTLGAARDRCAAGFRSGLGQLRVNRVAFPTNKEIGMSAIRGSCLCGVKFEITGPRSVAAPIANREPQKSTAEGRKCGQLLSVEREGGNTASSIIAVDLAELEALPSTAIFVSDQRADSIAYNRIPYTTEQGISKDVSGKIFRGTGKPASRPSTDLAQ
jgi:hypothetical protein